MSKKAATFLERQKIALIVIAAVVLAVLGYFLSLVIVETPSGEFEAGIHYQMVDEPRRIRGDQIEIMEIFSYGCIHCYNFDRPLHQWVESQGERIKFVQTPAVASEAWRVLGKAYYVMQALDIPERHHMALFKAIHDARLDLGTPEKLAKWFDGRDTTEAEFLASFSSPEITSLTDNADRMARRLKVVSVPTIVVNGKYLVRTTRQIGTTRMLEVMEFLIEQEIAAKQEG